MAAEKSGPYPPGDQPPAYPGAGTSVGPPLQGFAPPPGQQPPVGYPPQPAGYSQPPGYAQPGYGQPGVPPPPPGTYVAGQPVGMQPGMTVAQPVLLMNQQFR